MAWTYRSGRVSEYECQGRTCAVPACRNLPIYRIKATNEKGTIVEQRRCINHAAAFHHEKGLPFPPGMWSDTKTPRPEGPPPPPAKPAPPVLGTPPTPVEKPKRAPLLFAIPDAAPVAVCRSCSASVVWILTPAMKRMPVDAFGETRGQSHFSTCPNADAHRKARA